jgi:hypothetical protein
MVTEIKVPWGSWEYISTGICVWSHNPCLKMTEEEQYAENVKNGYSMDIKKW